MTPEQLKERNRRISEGQKQAWADPEIRARRTAAIRKAWDDPLLSADMRHQKIVVGSRRESEGWYDER
jgi:hypothetical protein